MTDLQSLKGIGPAMAAELARAGVRSVEALQETGVDAAYAAMLRAGVAPHFIAYYALHMALQGRPWNDCKGAEKEALRVRFDALKAGTAEQSEMEMALDRLGVGARR